MVGSCASSCTNAHAECSGDSDCTGCTGATSFCLPNNVPVFDGASPEVYKTEEKERGEREGGEKQRRREGERE
jgi:hypothetical protein